MRYLSLFSGIEACGIWKDKLGWGPVAFAEIEPFPCAALSHHYPDVPNLGNIMDITDDQIAQLGHIDVVVGGSPCQDLSIAGKRQGMTKDSGTRSSLFHHQIRIFDAARKHNGARFLLWENVPGAFSSNKRADFAAVVGEMVGAYPTIPKKWEKEGLAIGPNGLVEWCVLDAQWRGLAQRRKRVFALLDTGDWASRPPILLEPKSLSGDTPPSREARKEVAGNSGEGAMGCFGIDEECNVTDDHFGPLLRGGQGGTRQTVATNVSRPLTAAMGTKWNGNGDIESSLVIGPITAFAQNTRDEVRLQGDGFDGSEDGTGRGTPLVFDRQSNCEYGDGAIASTVSARDGKSATDLVVGPPLLIRMREGKEGGGKGPLVSEDQSLTLATANDQVLAIHPHVVGRSPDAGPQGKEYLSDGSAYTMDARGTAQSVMSQMQVRRLTPVECERLQGFPDDYLSQVVWKKKAPADGVQYKALGNSMARNVMLYIGERIEWALSHG